MLVIKKIFIGNRKEHSKQMTNDKRWKSKAFYLFKKKRLVHLCYSDSQNYDYVKVEITIFAMIIDKLINALYMH